jgi:VIT1/CCC1 family predicted Fe2+/Mn2+ transporter
VTHKKRRARLYILGINRGISELISPPDLEIREENISMTQTATMLACGAALPVLSFLLAVPSRAGDASKVLSGVFINACGAVVPGAKIALENEIPVHVEMTWQRLK